MDDSGRSNLRRFKKGESGSPGGRHGTRAIRAKLETKQGDRAIQKLFRRKSIPVVFALARIINDTTAPASVRVAAAQLFLDRAWGKLEPETAAKKSAQKKERPIVVVSPIRRRDDP